MLALFHELYPTRDISPATGEAWGVAFRNVSDERLQHAAHQVIREGGRTFFPTPGEVFARLPAVETGKVLGAGADAVDAWYAERAKTSQRVKRPALSPP